VVFQRRLVLVLCGSISFAFAISRHKNKGCVLYIRRTVQYIQYWATRPCAVSVEECSVGRRTGNAGLEMKII
jgi:hypothetical protein